MLIKATEDNRKEILNYCLDEKIINTFIIGDIENYGFSSENQDIWFEKDKYTIKGVALRYHTMLIVYSRYLNMDFTQIEWIIKNHGIEFISGIDTVIDELYPYLDDKYSRKDTQFSKYIKGHKLVPVTKNIMKATVDDAMEIAKTYGDIGEFKSLYSSDINIRYNQIKSRMETGEGIHIFVKDEDGIISHGNTTAENTFSGIIGGLFTRDDKRGMGFGSQIVSYLTKYLLEENKDIALFYEDKNLDKFFNKNGFKNIGTWTVLRRILDE